MGIQKALQPGKLTINGVEYPAIYSFRALSIMEEELGDHFTEVPARIIGKWRKNEAGELEFDQSNRLSARETAVVVSAMVRAAKGDLSPDDVLDMLTPRLVDEVAMQIMDIMLDQMPESGEDNEKNAEA